MKDSPITIGIDNREGTYFAARVDNSTGRPEVKALIRFDTEHFNGHHLLEGGEIVLALPDDNVIVKKIKLPVGQKQNEKLVFEMSQSLLDNSDNFLYDTVKTKIDDLYLGLIIRKSMFEQLQLPFLKQNGDLSISIKGMMRSHALAKGLLTFCSNVGSELGVVLDMNNEFASAAFYYDHDILDLISFSTVKYDISNEDSLKSIAVELQMILNFKIASFFENGITLPLSSLFVMGDLLSEADVAKLSEMMKISIHQPKINQGYLANQKDADNIPLDKYLVALGLTVD